MARAITRLHPTLRAPSQLSTPQMRCAHRFALNDMIQTDIVTTLERRTRGHHHRKRRALWPPFKIPIQHHGRRRRRARSHQVSQHPHLLLNALPLTVRLPDNGARSEMRDLRHAPPHPRTVKPKRSKPPNKPSTPSTRPTIPRKKRTSPPRAKKPRTSSLVGRTPRREEPAGSESRNWWI